MVKPKWNEWELPKLEVFFAKISPTIVGFAEKYGLKIEKYYHQFPSWDLNFKHPASGIGQIEIQKCGNSQVEIVASWWVDDFESSRRDFKQAKSVKTGLAESNLLSVLEENFKLILSWSMSDLEKGPVNPYREKITKQELEKNETKYPFPKHG